MANSRILCLSVEVSCLFMTLAIMVFQRVLSFVAAISTCSVTSTFFLAGICLTIQLLRLFMKAVRCRPLLLLPSIFPVIVRYLKFCHVMSKEFELSFSYLLYQFFFAFPTLFKTSSFVTFFVHNNNIILNNTDDKVQQLLRYIRVDLTNTNTITSEIRSISKLFLKNSKFFYLSFIIPAFDLCFLLKSLANSDTIPFLSLRTSNC